MTFAFTLRARLASFEHAYAVAVRLREASGRAQFVIRTDCPLQPVRVTDAAPAHADQVIAQVT